MHEFSFNTELEDLDFTYTASVNSMGWKQRCKASTSVRIVYIFHQLDAVSDRREKNVHILDNCLWRARQIDDKSEIKC